MLRGVINYGAQVGFRRIILKKIFFVILGVFTRFDIIFRGFDLT